MSSVPFSIKKKKFNDKINMSFLLRGIPVNFQEPTFPNSHSFSGGKPRLCAIVVTCLDTSGLRKVSRSGPSGATRATEKLSVTDEGKNTPPHIYLRKRKCRLEVRNVESASLNPQIFL